MLQQPGAVGWDVASPWSSVTTIGIDPSALVRVLTGPDALLDAGHGGHHFHHSYTWADKHHALFALARCSDDVIKQHIPQLLDALGACLFAFVFLQEWIKPSLLKGFASDLVSALTDDSVRPNTRGDERFFGAVQLCCKVDAAMVLVTPATMVAVYRRSQDREDRRRAASSFLDRCAGELFLTLLEAHGAEDVALSQLRLAEAPLRRYVLQRVCDLDTNLNGKLLRSRLALHAFQLLQDDGELDDRSRRVAGALITLYPASLRRIESQHDLGERPSGVEDGGGIASREVCPRVVEGASATIAELRYAHESRTRSRNRSRLSSSARRGARSPSPSPRLSSFNPLLVRPVVIRP